jgi:ElaB/YqjD/DUF883 family membrane-anchored ribosome-binding protein
MFKRETPRELRTEVSQLRGDVDNLVGAVSRLADSAFGSVRESARNLSSSSGREELYDAALEQGRRTARAAGQAVSDHPFMTAGVALGLGVLIGAVLLRRR